jgi:putative transposase
VVKPSCRREMAVTAVSQRGISIRKACLFFSVSENCYRYTKKNSSENQLIAEHLQKLACENKSWGFGLCFLYLRNVKGYHWNHKRVYRIYRELELNLRIKPKRRLVRETPQPLSVPDNINECWSMDFMYDQLVDGRSVRLFNVLDDCNREALGIETDFSLPSERVIRTLNRIIEWRGKPEAIRCDNGSEFTSKKTMKWATENDIELRFIEPGKPQQNAYIERFNRTVRYDWLGQYQFSSLSMLQDFSTRWLWKYNHERPNMALGGFTPNQHLQKLYLQCA